MVRRSADEDPATEHLNDSCSGYAPLASEAGADLSQSNATGMNDRERRQFLLEGTRVAVRLAEPDDVDAIIAFFAANEAHLTPSGAACVREKLTREHWSDQVERRRVEFLRDESCKTFIFVRDGGAVAGTANLSEIVRGPFQAAYLGYALAHAEQGKGLMHEALTLLLHFGFAELNLHRIMANFMPSNRRSGAVLERLGFTVEGRASDYLRINGAWREHVLTSLTNPAWNADRHIDAVSRGMFDRIDHVQLAMPVGEEAKARAFYAGVLGMNEIEKPEPLRARGGAWFRNGVVVVHLGVEQDFRPARKAHPALRVRDLRAFVDRLKEAGIEVAPDPILIDGCERCYVHDPFGNRIELIDA